MFLLDSCLTTAQPLPRQHLCKEGQLMLTQWQTWVVCTSLPSDAQALTQPGDHMICQTKKKKIKRHSN